MGLELEPFQRKIARTIFGPQRETLILLPRGNGKSCLTGALAVHHLLTTPRPAAYVAAASRDQARVIFEYARDFATHPAVEQRFAVRHLELRIDRGFLRVLASDAPKLHGLTPSYVCLDELHAFPDASVYEAMRTAMLKRVGSRMVVITTAGNGADTPLGRLRTRALAQPNVRPHGFLTAAHGPNIAMLEWAVPFDEDVDSARVVKRANPASWLTAAGLKEQREAVPDGAFRRLHANQWVALEGHWLPAGAWQACAGEATIEPGERVWIGLDAGGERSATAVVWLTDDLRVGCRIMHGDAAILEAGELIRELAASFDVAELVHDPWRAQQLALELEREGRMQVVAFPQSPSRLIPASHRLHRAIVERRLTHPNDPELNAHVANVIARDTPRGWRIDRAHRTACIDAVVALAMAVERAEARPEPVALLGWV